MTSPAVAIISNSSPLILYSRIGRLPLLQALFGTIGIPDAVYLEVVTAGLRRQRSVTDVSAILGALDMGGIIRLPLTNRARLDELPSAQGPGEAEAISLAAERRLPALLDDYDGRKTARRYNLRVIGSAGALRLAKQRGQLTHIRPLLDELRAAGLYLSDSVYQELLTIAGE